MKVSISLLAYNHEPYIEQAVRSVLAQRTNFDFELVVGEDCSTDRTLEILLRLQEEYPDKIRLLSHDRNLGMIQNSIRSYLACDGDYIALLDGDDYWCAEDKLQKQVDFLDLHPDFSIVFHDVLRIHEDGSIPPKVIRPDPLKNVYNLDDLVNSNFIPTCSALIRNGLIDEFPSWAYSLRMLDWLTFIMAARHGKIGYIDELMAVYRIHASGIWSSMELMKRHTAVIDLYEQLNPYLQYRYDGVVQSKLSYSWKKLMDELYDQTITLGSPEAAHRYVDEVWTLLKEHVSAPRQWKKEFLERVYSHYLFTSYESGNYPAARSAWSGMVRNNPGLLRNRGLFRIGMESTFNARWGPFYQRLTRSHTSKHE